MDSLRNSSSPLEFGVAELVSINSGQPSRLANFVGCFKNFEFRQTLDSPPIRPDLASVIRIEKRFGPGDTCYTCTQSDVNRASCQNGEVCTSCGFGEPECRDQLSPGDVCQSGEREIKFNVDCCKEYIMYPRIAAYIALEFLNL